ncbi:hypothetical protein M2158_004801 [Streptomyces sp. SAI-144]|uniref:hypothetical protein n=1 Tax=Streptomyces sp. SAI-144 TaxID=2940544 RepID=UPI0024746FB8|nr:hypothetical protein [Streptomyces sp. SAI-144]MDH6436261.1 hypothetical protein [Streptomyces sp. SAI-144]
MGAGTAVRHVLGNDSGGGYEWAATHARSPAASPPSNSTPGAGSNAYRRMDGAYADTAMFTALAQCAIEH